MKPHVKDKVSITLAAVAEDEALQRYFTIIDFLDIHGNKTRLVLPRSSLRSVSGMIQMLDDAGASLPVSDRETKKLVRSLLSSERNAPRWKFAPATGWYDGHRVFIHPHEVIGRVRGHGVVKPPRRRKTDHNAALRIRGSHKDWQRSIATPARFSSRIVLGICAALAAPLLDFVDLNSFGIRMCGPGKAGKSILLAVAGSVIGFASEQDLFNFRTADAAFGGVPAAFNDMLLPLNEPGPLKGRLVDRNERIRDLSYGFAEGRRPTYSKLATIDGEGAKRTWCSIALGTGEEAIDEISTAAGTTRMTGASITWIDLPAVRKGIDDDFDRCPDEIKAADRRTWVRQLCKGLRRACRTNHGVAIKHFIERVIKNRRTIRLDLQRLTDRFVEKEVREGDGPAVEHLAMCFGHLEAAGILGVRLKTLPWQEEVVRSCVRQCYRDARRALRTEADLLREGLRVLRKKLEGQSMLDLTQATRVSKQKLKASDGYFQKTELGLEATIRAGRFKMWFKDPRQANIVVRWLHGKAALSTKGTPPTKPGTGIVWAESQPQWPGGSRPRSICIDLSSKSLEQIRLRQT
jgi:hypothetical protein